VPKRVFLDTSILSLACKRPGDAAAEACRRWIKGLLEAGHRVTIPEITHYELRRELLRCGFGDWLQRLDVLVATLDYLAITTAAMLRAAELWAEVRRAGQMTAPPEALDGDAILAAQAVTATGLGETLIIATTNVGHLERFPGVTAQPWQYIA
jgi:predicted nucleic acid-binding protein